MHFKLHFWWLVAVRFCRIFFCATKEIHLISLAIDRNETSESIVVRFELRNMIWAQISRGEKTIGHEIVLYGTIVEIAEKTLLIQGFFQQKTYMLSAFINEPWKLKPFTGSLYDPANISLLLPSIKLIAPALSICQESISYPKQSIKIIHSTFSNIDLI